MSAQTLSTHTLTVCIFNASKPYAWDECHATKNQVSHWFKHFSGIQQRRFTEAYAHVLSKNRENFHCINSKSKNKGSKWQCTNSVKGIRSNPTIRYPDCASRAIAKHQKRTPKTKTVQIQKNTPLSLHNRFTVLPDFI